jgi:hypothetical protein
MPVKRTFVAATLAGIAFFAASAPGAPILEPMVSPNPDSTFTLIRGGHGGGGHGGAGGGFSGFGGSFGGGRTMGGFGPSTAGVQSYGGRSFGARPFATRTYSGRPALRGERFVRGHRVVSHHRHHRRRFFVSGFGWVDSDYCTWPYNWGPWCDNY